MHVSRGMINWNVHLNSVILEVLTGSHVLRRIGQRIQEGEGLVLGTILFNSVKSWLDIQYTAVKTCDQATCAHN